MKNMLLCLMMAALGNAGPAYAAEEAPAIAVAIKGFGKKEKGESLGLVAVWSDGKIVWSENRKDGGEPYRTASI